MSRQIGWARVDGRSILFTESCREALSGKWFDVRVNAAKGFISLMENQSEHSRRITNNKKQVRLYSLAACSRVGSAVEEKRLLPVYEKRPGLYYIKF